MLSQTLSREQKRGMAKLPRAAKGIMLGKRLKQIRKEKKITQEEISVYLGVKRQTYSAYEREVSIPDSLTLKKLADYFGVSTDYFFQDDAALPIGATTPQEQKLLLLARRAERIPESQRERLFKSFEDNIELYLEAIGATKNDR